MPDMLNHFASLLSRPWLASTGWLSASTPGLIVQIAVVPILLFALTLLAFFIEGKGTLPNRARTLAIGLLLGLCGDVLVYGSIFSWKIIEVTYLDHQHLVSTIRRLHDELVAK